MCIAFPSIISARKRSSVWISLEEDGRRLTVEEQVVMMVATNNNTNHIENRRSEFVSIARVDKTAETRRASRLHGSFLRPGQEWRQTIN